MCQPRRDSPSLAACRCRWRAPGSRRSVDSAADPAQPGIGGVPFLVGLAPLLGPVPPGGGIRTEKFTTGQAGVEVTQAVRHHLVPDVTRQVDDEAVVAEGLFG